MYAVIRTGGKQYRVAENDVIRVEKLAGAAGEALALDEVLMLGNGADLDLGAPLVDGARVMATILDQTRAPKIIVFKKKRRKNYRRKMGHRQDLTVLRITDILPAGAKAKPVTVKEAPKKAEKTEQAAAKPAAKATEAPKKPVKAKAKPVKAKAAPKKAGKAPAKAPAKAKTAAKKPAQARKPKQPAAAKDAAKGTAKSAKSSASARKSDRIRNSGTAKKSSASKGPARKAKGRSKEKS